MRRHPNGFFSAARWIVSCFTFFAMLSAARIRAQASDEADEYKRAIAGALQEYNVGNFAEAHALFERAHAVRPSARTWRGIGMTCFELRKYLRAREALQAALRDSRQPLTPAQRREAEQLLERTGAYIGTLHIQTTPASATVMLDGEPISGEQSVELGDHELTLRAPGYLDLTRRISVEGGKLRALSFSLVPSQISPARAARSNVQASDADARPSPVAQSDHESRSVLERWWFWTAAGAIIAGGVITAVALSPGGKAQALLPGDTGDVIYARFSPGNR